MPGAERGGPSTNAAPATLAPIRFGREVCGDLAQAERREWWVGNGRGGYAGGTIALTLTRRYHGLLIAPIDPPLGRTLILAKADATLIDGHRRAALFTNRWASGAVEPRGYLALESFHLDGTIPVWRFALGDRVIEHRVWMEAGADTTYAAWRLDGVADDPSAELSIVLLGNARDHHGVTWMPGFSPQLEARGTGLSVTVPNGFALRLIPQGGTIAPLSGWCEDFDLPAERQRGLPDRDAHRHLGEARLSLRPGQWAGIAATLDPNASTDLEAALARRRARDRAVLTRAGAADPVFAQTPDCEVPGWVSRLVLATDLYLISRPVAGLAAGRSVIAGYPWFGDWGRDTMIALPGLCLATGCFEAARTVLQTFARFLDRGMVPNLFPEAGATPEYNTVDAALWYIAAWRAYVAATRDIAALREVFPALADIVEWHVKGTRYGIAMDPEDGLLRAGEPGVQLTWMDARVDGREITPRIGKPVEINALWYNALCALAQFADRTGQPAESYRLAAGRVRGSFARFLLPDGGGLYDVLDGPAGSDPTRRPNQIVALSLPDTPLDDAVRHAVLAACGPDLVTSYGLRSLDPHHADYRRSYAGGVAERDGSYHQGPVWAWLLGHWALAHYRVHGDAAAAQRWLAPIGDHLADAGLGQVSEIFDGDPPHTPRGAPAQAWSVACTLEAWWRLEHIRRGDADPLAL